MLYTYHLPIIIFLNWRRSRNSHWDNKTLSSRSFESAIHSRAPGRLYIRGHLDGTLLARMLVDGGAAVNLMPYSTFKKLGKTDAELIKMNMTITGIEGEDPSILRPLRQRSSPWEARQSPLHFLSWRYKVTTTLS
jgi:hypothetical protein